MALSPHIVERAVDIIAREEDRRFLSMMRNNFAESYELQPVRAQMSMYDMLRALPAHIRQEFEGEVHDERMEHRVRYEYQHYRDSLERDRINRRNPFMARDVGFSVTGATISSFASFDFGLNPYPFAKKVSVWQKRVNNMRSI